MTQSPPPPTPPEATLVGVGGAGLRAAAEYLRDAGCEVWATDADLRRLAGWSDAMGVRLIDATAAPRGGLLIHTAAVDGSHPQVAAATALGMRVRSYPQWLGDVSRERPVVAVAGTHGKTTTAALLRTALGDCSYLTGGVCRQTGRSGRCVPDGPVVVEACEYRRHFLELSPQTACVLPVEWDHPDAFASPADVRAAFEAFRRQVRGAVLEMSEVVGTSPGRNVGRGQEVDCPPNLGPHLIGNAALAVHTAGVMGVSAALASERLAGFPGVRRRFEVLTDGPATWVDDYAHHPTAIASTLAECRRVAGGRPVVAAFEPHQSGRLRAFAGKFVEALSLADEVLVLPVFAAREAGDGSAERARLLASLGGRAVAAADLDHLARLLQTRRARDPAGVFAVLGAGRIGRLLDERFPHLRETRPVCGDHAA